jgi:hypothetical protein
MLLNTNSGIFFEFVPLDQLGKKDPQRVSLADVKVGQQYALIINSNAGLWGYDIGDIVRFVSVDPYRVVVTGRTKHFISAFGEHVIGEEVEYCIREAALQLGVGVTEFTVAPCVSTTDAKSFHEWFIEFDREPPSIDAMAQLMNQLLCQKNVYYNDLISGNILSSLQIRQVRKGGFIDYMRSVGKLGGQNKVPRLSNDRTLADALTSFIANH